MAYRVFVSHSTEDVALLNQLQYSLSQYGIEVFLAELFPDQPGLRVSDQVRTAIQACDCVLAILTLTGHRSLSVNYELGLAQASRKLIIPILENGLSLPPHLSSLSALDYVPFNRWDPASAISAVSAFVAGKKLDKENQQKALAGAVLAIGLLALAYASQQKS